MRAVRGGVCEMCICLALRGVGLTNPVGTWGEWDVCLCLGCDGVGGVGGGSGWVAYMSGSWVVLCMCVL